MKVQSVAFALVFVAALALAAGADWIEQWGMNW
jgi:hypothetical protein